MSGVEGLWAAELWRGETSWEIVHERDFEALNLAGLGEWRGRVVAFVTAGEAHARELMLGWKL